MTRYFNNPLPSQDDPSASKQVSVNISTPVLSPRPTNQPTHHDTSPSMSGIEQVNHSGGQTSQPFLDPLSSQVFSRPT